MVLEIIDPRQIRVVSSAYDGGVFPAIAVFMTNTYLLQVMAIDSLGTFEGALADLDINARQYVLLGVASSKTDLSQADIASNLGVDATVLGKLVQDLEVRGLLERRRVVEDRRRHELLITRKGRTLLSKAEALRATSENESLAKLNADDRQALRMLLMKAVGIQAAQREQSH
jgi:DNA-binding MarR family transcriptional regulator